VAFQGKQPFFAFLQGTSATALEEAAPAENCILDERVPDARRDEFLALNGFASVAPDKNSWFKQHIDYAKAHVALPAISGTFTAINRENWQGWSPDWDVVRVETLYGLNERALNKGTHISDRNSTLSNKLSWKSGCSLQIKAATTAPPSWHHLPRLKTF